MEKITKKFANNHGITWIGLMVSIIISCIFANVTLNLVTGKEQKIMNKAVGMVSGISKAALREELEIILVEYTIDYYNDKYVEEYNVGSLANYVASQIGTGKEGRAGTISMVDDKMIYTALDGETVLVDLEVPDLEAEV